MTDRPAQPLALSAPLPPAEPEPRFPSPYRRPTAPLVLARRVEAADGAQIAAFVYAPPTLAVAIAEGGPVFSEAGPAPVLLLHGNGEEHGIFGPIVDAATTAGRVVVAVDSRAQGKSTRGTASFTYELMADDAVAVLDALGVGRTHVAGFSDGAIEALLIARDHPERVASLLSIGANLTPEGVIDDGWDLEGSARRNQEWAGYWDDRFAAQTTCTPDACRLPIEGPADTYAGVPGEQLGAGTSPVGLVACSRPRAIDPGLLFCDPQRAAEQAELLQLMVDHPHIDAASLTAIACPTCVMAGEHDCIVEDETRAIAAAIPGARLVIVPKQGHGLPKHAPADVACELLVNILIAGC